MTNYKININDMIKQTLPEKEHINPKLSRKITQRLLSLSRELKEQIKDEQSATKQTWLQATEQLQKTLPENDTAKQAYRLLKQYLESFFTGYQQAQNNVTDIQVTTTDNNDHCTLKTKQNPAVMSIDYLQQRLEETTIEKTIKEQIISTFQTYLQNGEWASLTQNNIYTVFHQDTRDNIQALALQRLQMTYYGHLCGQRNYYLQKAHENKTQFNSKVTMAIAPQKTQQTNTQVNANNDTLPIGLQRFVETECTFNDVIGLDKAKQEALRAIRLIEDHENTRRHGLEPRNGMLLYGPPGTGKTLFAKALAGELGYQFLIVKFSEVNSKWIGETEKNISAIFEYAREQTPCILFIDEFDSVANSRTETGSSADAHRNNAVNTLLQEMDGITTKNKQQPIILAATNYRDNLDSAVLRPGRLDIQVKVTLPNQEERKKLLELFANNRLKINSNELQEFASKLQHWSPAHIKNLLQQVKYTLYERNPDEILPITLEELETHRQEYAINHNITKTTL